MGLDKKGRYRKKAIHSSPTLFSFYIFFESVSYARMRTHATTMNDLPMTAHHMKGSLAVLSFQVCGLFFLFFIISVAVTLFLLGFVGEEVDAFVTVFVSLQLLVFFVFMGFILFATLRWSTFDYYVSTTHLVVYGGIVTLKEKIYDLNTIRKIELQESVLGKLFGYGDLIIMFATSGYHEEVRLKDVANPKLYERILKEYTAQLKK